MATTEKSILSTNPKEQTTIVRQCWENDRQTVCGVATRIVPTKAFCGAVLVQTPTAETWIARILPQDLLRELLRQRLSIG